MSPEIPRSFTMPNLASTELTMAAGDLAAAADVAAKQASPEAFETLEQRINRFATSIRELQQAQLKPQVKSAIKNLESGRPLAADEASAVRALIVGDAERYIALENDCPAWMTELQRLMGEITRLADSADNETLATLRGVVKDAVRLVPTMRAHAEERRRVEQFERAFARLDDANRALLIQLLREMLDSPNR